MEQRMAAKLFRLMDNDGQDYLHDASLFSCIMQVEGHNPQRWRVVAVET
jgi:hypothetical protein